MNKIKPILPSLRERKRYLAFEIISEDKAHDFSAVSKALWQAFYKCLGEFECSRAGIQIVAEKYNANLQRGLLRVNNRYVNHIKSALIFIDHVSGTNAIVRSVGVSGMISKAQRQYL
ncbi:MAG: Rpp14/Pop5 family protein [Candidatus Woesearchaeota archaeon]